MTESNPPMSSCSSSLQATPAATVTRASLEHAQKILTAQTEAETTAEKRVEVEVEMQRTRKRYRHLEEECSKMERCECVSLEKIQDCTIQRLRCFEYLKYVYIRRSGFAGMRQEQIRHFVTGCVGKHEALQEACEKVLMEHMRQPLFMLKEQGRIAEFYYWWGIDCISLLQEEKGWRVKEGPECKYYKGAVTEWRLWTAEERLEMLPTVVECCGALTPAILACDLIVVRKHDRHEDMLEDRAIYTLQ